MIHSCDNCGSRVFFVTGKSIYHGREDLYNKFYYLCRTCYSYVGVHRGTKVPLGNIANSKQRKLRRKTHSAFDPLWKEGSMTRSEAYSWMGEVLGLEKKDCHIAMLSEGNCLKLIDEVKKRKEMWL